MNKAAELTQQDRITGCLLGGAVGDALGAPVEFLSLQEIRLRFGDGGIRRYAPEYGRVGAITDDTQMTLFTLEGMLRGLMRGRDRGVGDLEQVVLRAYQRWLYTQGERPPYVDEDDHAWLDGWLLEQKLLHSRRAPGNSCLSALRTGKERSIRLPINDSKGCGAVMRMAPVGFFDDTDHFRVGCELGALTHGHPSGYLAAGFLAHAVGQLTGGADLPGAIASARAELVKWERHEECSAAVDEAVELPASGEPSAEKVTSLGAGWVAEEALAIGIYCALVADDFESGVVLAVNHDGDSDSTGAITGNLLGAMLGPDSIPGYYLDELEVRELVMEMSADAAMMIRGERLYVRYPPY